MLSEFLSAVMDLVYLIFTVIRNGICRGILDTMPTWMAIIYPHFIYPMYYISLFCTVQMVVAISIERLFAISAPIGHNPRCRIYILTVVFFSGNECNVEYIFNSGVLLQRQILNVSYHVKCSSDKSQ